MKTYIHALIIILLLSTLVLGVLGSILNQYEEPVNTYSYLLVKENGSHWGYKILKKEKTIIYQPFIPAVKGNQGFRTREDARRVAKLVVEKLSRGDTPTLSIMELEKLNVIFE